MAGISLIVIGGILIAALLLIGLNIWIARWAITRLLRGPAVRFPAPAARPRPWVVHVAVGRRGFYLGDSTTSGKA